jgi:transposase-like protein
MELNIKNLIDDEKCFQTVRNIRWPSGVKCPHCNACNIIKRGKDDTEDHKQRYECKSCGSLWIPGSYVNNKFINDANTAFPRFLAL